MNKIQDKIDEIYRFSKKTCDIKENKLKSYGLTGISLRPYQLDGVNWLYERYDYEHGCILGDEMGLGKTCQTISFLVYLHGSGVSKGPFLIISPLSVMGNWQNELARFAPNLDVIPYVGKAEHREGPLRAQIKKKKNQLCIILTTYEIFLKDSSFLKRRLWHTLIVDEAHRLKNRQSLLHQTLLDFDVQHRILLTGTPVQNNLKELYSLLCFVAPKIFKEQYMDRFVERFDEVGEKKDVSELHKILKPFLLRRVKSEVVKDLPKKSELVLYHGMSAVQKKYYRAILTKDISVFESGASSSRTSLMNILMQLRKCVDHPYLFDGVEPEPFQLGEHLVEASGKLVLIDQLLGYLKAKGHKVLLFSQMTRMLDILQDYLGYRGYTYERLDGSVRGEERYLAVDNFNEADDIFLFLLSTKAGGVGLNLVAADTVIFVDSDFNPQNDLQAAARAHRIGQTRPVKIIRLIGRSTVEEIILRRAESKLKLTETVIEGGQFSLDATKKEDLIADKDVKLQDILKFGFDKLFANDESTIEDLDFDTLLGKSVKGEWTEDETIIQNQATLAATSMEVDDNEDNQEAANMYVFEGTDYSKEPSTADVDAFEQLIQEYKTVSEEQSTSDGRALRRTKSTLLSGVFPELSRKPQRQLTEQEKEELKQKREEAVARRKQQAEELQQKKLQAQKKRREALWKEHRYTSCNLILDSEGESDTDDVHVPDGPEEDDESTTEQNHRQIHYILGDVTQPQKPPGNNQAFIVHCLDDSGSWGTGGIFSAISKRSDDPEQHYTLAGEMKDLALGDTHLVPLDSKKITDENEEDYLALIVAQHRDKRGNLSGIKLSALSQALKRLCKAAKQMQASVHLPRIGHKTPGFNWYGTERLIRKHLCGRNIPTYIYYYPRQRALKRKASTDDSQAGTSNDMLPSLKKNPTVTTSTAGAALKQSHSRTSSRSDSSSPVLPCFMAGVCCHFFKVPTDVVKRLTRYLIAFDGDVHKTVTKTTTHVIVNHCDRTKPCDTDLKSAVSDSDVQVLHYEWLDECFNAKYQTDSNPWKIAV